MGRPRRRRGTLSSCVLPRNQRFLGQRSHRGKLRSQCHGSVQRLVGRERRQSCSRCSAVGTPSVTRKCLSYYFITANAQALTLCCSHGGVLDGSGEREWRELLRRCVVGNAAAD